MTSLPLMPTLADIRCCLRASQPLRKPLGSLDSGGLFAFRCLSSYSRFGASKGIAGML
jgi:hypothetical protein